MCYPGMVYQQRTLLTFNHFDSCDFNSCEVNFIGNKHMKIGDSIKVCGWVYLICYELAISSACRLGYVYGKIKLSVNYILRIPLCSQNQNFFC